LLIADQLVFAMLPFSRDEFISVFVAYNNAIWPAQVAAYLLGAAIVALMLWGGAYNRRIIALAIATMWLWTGVAYHALFFTPINPAAYLFSALFVAQAVLLVAHGVLWNGMAYSRPAGIAGWTGVGLVAYSALFYPLIGVFMGHPYPEMPMFGVTPCPVTLFTFGLFLLAKPPLPVSLLIVPVAWSLMGGSAAILLSIPQDWLLLASGFIAAPLVLLRNRNAAAEHSVGTATH
jgi:hypothetical protein